MRMRKTRTATLEKYLGGRAEMSQTKKRKRSSKQQNKP